VVVIAERFASLSAEKLHRWANFGEATLVYKVSPAT